MLVFVVLSSYECNLRAYLMAVQMEPAVNTDQDLIDQNVSLVIFSCGSCD